MQAKLIRTLRSLLCFFAGLVLTVERLVSRPESGFPDECLPPEEEPNTFI